MADKDRVCDELLAFLSDIVFQIPVRTFMEENSIIFDPTVPPSKEHSEVHERYKKLVDILLDAFMKDHNLSHEDAIKEISRMNAEDCLRQMFQEIFEQVLAALDFNIFMRLMVKRNLELQQQVLLVILHTTGSLPDSMTPPSAHVQPVVVTHSPADNAEKIVMDKVLQQSKVEQQKNKSEMQEIKKTVVVAQHGSKHLEKAVQEMDESLKKMSLEAKPAASTGMTTTQTGSIKTATVPAQATSDKRTASEAAASWLQSAQTESSESAAAAAMASQFSQMSPDELKRRQEFLKQQRDKLLAMKKSEREKQLLKAETTQANQRPRSARAARSAMNQKEPAVAPVSEEDDKKRAMRKAIADRLRQEVIKKD